MSGAGSSLVNFNSISVNPITFDTSNLTAQAGYCLATVARTGLEMLMALEFEPDRTTVAKTVAVFLSGAKTMLGPSTVDELSAWWPAPAQGSWFSRAVPHAPSLDPNARKWCCRWVSNLRPLPYQGSALPLSYGSIPVGYPPRHGRKPLHEAPTAGKLSGSGRWGRGRPAQLYLSSEASSRPVHNASESFGNVARFLDHAV